MSARFFSELAVLFLVLSTAVGIGAWYGNSLKTAYAPKDRKIIIAKPHTGEKRFDPNAILPSAGPKNSPERPTPVR